ncbi:hypothetical protein [Paenibacillus eucommiae]|uniref:2C-methyl-D-erythritol 2,4-cyclodiphosphate synthase n=1 Tax=Paenibacillus eucommiae TaxID=1355755 RepID=A0ABS4J3M8_9BACL|nr:hypothetical protein [Paenibacillus eucommiae]MBP1993701.1 2C-methyl-D-erythritol 2,4-cyclodiphosphate synthase [Paenibacillus eucommiae]
MEQELKSLLESIIKNQETLKSEVNARFDNIDVELSAIRTQLNRIETEANEDIIATLEIINNKLELTATKEDIGFLAGKLGQHELEIDRLKRVK